MAKKKVLVASNMYPGPHGPFYGVFVARQVQALRAFDDLELCVAAIDDPRKGLHSPLKYARFLRDLVRAIAQQRPHVIHFHYALPTALPAPVLRRLQHIPYVITLHGGDFYELPKKLPLGRVLNKTVLKHAASLIVVGQGLARDVQTFLGEACPPLHVINMGVDVPAFAAVRPTAPQPVNRLCFVGQLIHRKGVDVLLAALAELPKDVHLTIVGDGPARPSLEELTRVLNLRDRVKFVGAQLPQAVPALMAQAGTLVVPSRTEPLGIVALEGMAAGCVVVASRVGGLAELVRHGENGFLAPPDNAYALSQVLLDLMSADGLAKIRSQAVRTAQDNSVQAQAQKVHQVLLEVH